jgi:hypothetical protein
MKFFEAPLRFVYADDFLKRFNAGNPAVLSDTFRRFNEAVSAKKERYLYTYTLLHRSTGS